MNELLEVATGDLSERARVLAALSPALMATAVFVLGLPVFAIRAWMGRAPPDAETEARGATLLVGKFLRSYFFWLVRPVISGLLRAGIPAQVITALAVLLGAGSAFAVAEGRFALGGWLFIFAGILDAIDGRIARAQHGDSLRGAAMDSILDRYTDSFILIGLAWYWRDTWVLLPVLISFLGSSLVPYVRARGEALGVALGGTGVMQRAERVVVLGGSIALSPVLEVVAFGGEEEPMHWLAALGVSITAVASNTTAISRFLALLEALGGQVARLPRWLASRLWTAALLATLSDFTMTLVVLHGTGHDVLGAWLRPRWLVLAGAMALGALCGAVLGFAAQRAFAAFDVGHPGARASGVEGLPQAAGAPRGLVVPSLRRWALVSTMKLVLNVGAVLLLPFGLLLSWWIARVAVYLAWSLPIERWLVAAPPADGRRPPGVILDPARRLQ